MIRSASFVVLTAVAATFFAAVARAAPPSNAFENTVATAARANILDDYLELSVQPLAAQADGKSALQREAETLFARGRYEEARAICQRGLAEAEKKHGRESEEASWWHNQLSLALGRLERHEEAEAHLKRAIAIRERLFGPDDALTLTSVYNLGLLYHKTGRIAEAEPLLERVVATTTEIVGADHWVTATFASGLAELYKSQGRLAEAEQLMRRIIGVFEKKWGPDHSETAIVVSNLALVLQLQGRLVEAEPLMRRALSAMERNLGAHHPLLAIFLSNLGAILTDGESFAEAEALLLRALDIRERKLGAAHSQTANALHNIALLYMRLYRLDEASPVMNRALAIAEKAWDAGHPNVVTMLTNAAQLDARLERFIEAERRYKQALAAIEKRRTSNPALIAGVLNNLGRFYLDQGKQTEAEPNLLRALKLYEAVGNGVFVANVHISLAESAYERNDLVTAASHADRALDLLAQVWPPGHPQIGVAHHWRSLIALKRGMIREALEASAAAVDILAEDHEQASRAALVGSRRKPRSYDNVFAQHLRAAFALADAQPQEAGALREGAVRSAQLLAFDETADAVGRTAARLAEGTDALAKLLREQRALAKRLAALDQRVADALGSADPSSRAQAPVFRTEIAAVRARLLDIDATLRRDHKRYADLSAQRPLTIAEAQALQGDSDAAVILLPAGGETFLFALSRTEIVWRKTPMTRSALADAVTLLRRQLDPDQWQGTFAPFDRALAHRLYRDLWSPLEPALKDKTNVSVVATGPLTSLPLAALLTEEPSGGAAADVDPNVLRTAPWLIKRHALTTLPSLSSLAALHAAGATPSPREPFVGFGDPSLSPTRERAARSVANVFRGPSVDTRALRALPELPQTAHELRALAKVLGASETRDVYVRDRASEGELKTRDLSKKRVVAFATHALTAGDMGLGEAGLVFTPPAIPGARDDGYLTASEAAALNLNADWVILSACNTAAGNEPGARGLSGLARAFFLAGARALLVSHWAMWDDTAERLTTTTMKTFQANPKSGRAEALRQAMLTLMNDQTDPRFAHPAAWAPFVIVGETRAK